MNTVIRILAMVSSLAIVSSGAETNSSVSPKRVFLWTNDDEVSIPMPTNLSSTSVDELINITGAISTNGLETVVDITSSPIEYGVGRPPLSPPVCFIYIANHMTNLMSILNMPETNLIRIALLDDKGREIERTQFGKAFGGALSQNAIDFWFNHWTNTRESRYMRFLGTSLNKDSPEELCIVSLKDIFQIKEAGDYVVHVQVRVIQSARDSSGKLHYLLGWLPEVTARFHEPVSVLTIETHVVD